MFTHTAHIWLYFLRYFVSYVKMYLVTYHSMIIWAVKIIIYRSKQTQSLPTLQVTPIRILTFCLTFYFVNLVILRYKKFTIWNVCFIWPYIHSTTQRIFTEFSSMYLVCFSILFLYLSPWMFQTYLHLAPSLFQLD